MFKFRSRRSRSAPSSPFTGTVLPQGRPFWIVDGRAYDFTEWMGTHPGGSTWFTQTMGRDISALLHLYPGAGPAAEDPREVRDPRARPGGRSARTHRWTRAADRQRRTAEARGAS